MSMTTGKARPAPGSSEDTHARLARHVESLVYAEPRSREAREAAGLKVMRGLLQRLGNPHVGLNLVHVAGSKGKGSTVLAAEAVLRAAGLLVGTFTSPHLERWTERIRVDGRDIDPQELLLELRAMRRHVAELERLDPANPPTFFEVLTAAALTIFQRRKVDWVLLEAGLGGRLDATNAATPRVSCITSIELEHTDRLGNDLAAIATEKAGIAKPGIPLVIGALEPAAHAAISHVADSVGAPVLAPSEGYSSALREVPGDLPNLTVATDRFQFSGSIASPSRILASNVAIALVALNAAQALREPRLQQAARRALPSLRLPGRCELLSTHPPVLIDSAHTEASARALAIEVERLGLAPVHLLVSFSAARNLDVLARILGEIGDFITVCRADASRSLPAEAAADALRLAHPQRQIRVLPEADQALSSAWAKVPEGGLLCIAGSVYLSGAARRHFVRQDRTPGATGPSTNG